VNEASYRHLWMSEPLDLTNCDREPIHIPGGIQPYGVLLVLAGPDLTIVQCSDNTAGLLGVPPQQMLDQPLHAFIGETAAKQIATTPDDDLKMLNPLPLRVNEAAMNALAHRAPDGRLVFEIEPDDTANAEMSLLHREVQRSLRRLQRAETVETLCQSVAEQMRDVSGYDRVMIYRFDASWNGLVIAEAKVDALEPFLGLQYPASDIPKQARALYAQNPLRLVHSSDYTPAAMLSIESDPAPLDMSFALLRSVSPIHLEYLRNMGVGASMSISILKEGQLWGLVACHHRTAHTLSYDLRATCELLTQMFAVRLTERENTLKQRQQANSEKVLNVLTAAMQNEENDDAFVGGLLRQDVNLLDLVEADGALVCLNGECHMVGSTPSTDDITRVVNWLWKSTDSDVFYTHSLAQVDEQFTDIRATASGLLAIRISRVQSDYVIWFRQEQIEAVTWGGDPTKRLEVDETTGETRLRPRKSFEAWQSLVALQALPWEPWEIDAATRLRSVIIDTVLRIAGELRLRADILARLNKELARSNDELDSFAYIASHDLKEPLRGIHNYASFLLEDYGETLPADGVDKLQTLVRLSRRMEELINSLLHFSRVGRVDLSVESVDLNEVVADVLGLLGPRLETQGVQIDVGALPTLTCDRVRVGEIFNNLITNAAKYHDDNDRQIVIRQESPPEPNYVMISVTDNGIGVPEKHKEAIFRIFKRLHSRKAYDGGNGAGLTIVRKIVERHDGQVWVESEVGKGSTFYFTLKDLSAEVKDKAL